jgi:hypothetical protein
MCGHFPSLGPNLENSLGTSQDPGTPEVVSAPPGHPYLCPQSGRRRQGIAGVRHCHECLGRGRARGRSPLFAARAAGFARDSDRAFARAERPREGGPPAPGHRRTCDTCRGIPPGRPQVHAAARCADGYHAQAPAECHCRSVKIFSYTNCQFCEHNCEWRFPLVSFGNHIYLFCCQ